MFGYILAGIAGLLLLAFCLGVLGGGRLQSGGTKVRKGGGQPSADAPTPDRSVTATTAEMDIARRHTPPS